MPTNLELSRYLSCCSQMNNSFCTNWVLEHCCCQPSQYNTSSEDRHNSSQWVQLLVNLCCHWTQHHSSRSAASYRYSQQERPNKDKGQQLWSFALSLVHSSRWHEDISRPLYSTATKGRSVAIYIDCWTANQVLQLSMDVAIRHPSRWLFSS
jgi:hypothetical protein